MLTKRDEDIASGKWIAEARPRQKPTVTLTSVSILVRERKGSTLKHDDHTIISVMKCQKPWPDYYDMISQSFEEATERSIAVTSSKSRKKKFDGASAVATWGLEINYGTRMRSEEKIPIMCESKLFQSIPVPSSNSRTFRRKCCWSCVARH